MKEAYNTLKDEVELYSVFGRDLENEGTVNVPPEDATKAKKLLEEAGYKINSMEELVENIPGDGYGEEFTRINFRES